LKQSDGELSGVLNPGDEWDLTGYANNRLERSGELTSDAVTIYYNDKKSFKQLTVPLTVTWGK
jgi:hypothetical protein